MIEFTPKQQQVFDAILSGQYRFILYGGSIRGGKTYGEVSCIVALALLYPKSRWTIVRKDLPTMRRNVLPTFDKIRNDAGIEDVVGAVNMQTWASTLSNGSEILFFAENWERDKDLNRWRGLETNGFYLDEVNELQEVSFDKAIERAGSWIAPGKRPPSVILMSANPCRNWVKEKIYDKWKSGDLKAPWLYIPATPLDNPHLPEDYKTGLLDLKEKNPIAYARFVEGDWDVSDGDYFARNMFRFHDGHDPRDYTLLFLADIAYTRKKTSDFCAMGLAGIDAVGGKVWFETKIERMDTEESTTYLLSKAAEYNARGLIVPFAIEANEAYIELLKQRAKMDGVKIHIRQLSPAGQAKADRIAATKMGMNLWDFDRASQGLVNQFLDWSPLLDGVVPDDGPDMHAYADVELKWDPHQVSGWKQKPPADSMAAKVWKAQKRKPTSERTPKSW